MWLLLAGVNGALAVGADAYAWHALGGSAGLGEMMVVGARHHLIHSLALLAVAWLADAEEGRRRRIAAVSGVAFTVGILLFSGTLYVLALTGVVLLEGAAPVGGALLMVGWLALAWAGLQRLRAR